MKISARYRKDVC